MAAPPRLAAWIVTRLTVEADRQAVVGDLLEEFTALNKQFGPGRARRWFWRQALTSALPGLRRRLHERTDSHRSPKDRLMSSLWQDVRFGWRSIQRRPLVTIVAVLSLMVGISMSSVVFSLLDAAVLSPLDVKDPRGLALVLNRRGPDNVNHNFSYPDFTDYRAGQQTFVDLVAYSSAEVTMRPAGGVAEVVQAELVSGGFFPTIGPRVIAGRGIVESDDQPGAAPVIVMNEVLWRRLFGDPRAFEPKSLLVNDREFSVIGIVAATFHGMTIGSNARLWAAVHQQPVLEPDERHQSAASPRHELADGHGTAEARRDVRYRRGRSQPRRSSARGGREASGEAAAHPRARRAGRFLPAEENRFTAAAAARRGAAGAARRLRERREPAARARDGSRT